MKRSLQRVALGLVLMGAVPVFAAGPVVETGPVELRVDNLRTPLGIDDPAPHFSWQLNDPARGARQTAYEVMVATKPEILREGKANVWDSGRVEGDASLNVRYQGPALAASTRYFWRVKVWGVAGKSYAASETSWWETGLAPQRPGPVAGDPGLLTQDAWRAGWIGYETPEEVAVRHAPAQWISSPDAAQLVVATGGEQHFAYRTTVMLEKPVKHAALYATAEDTVSAWVNGARVMTAQTFPPWHQMPWKKFVRADVTAQLTAGRNSLAIEQVDYSRSPARQLSGPPMIATLVVEYADGATAAFASDTTWKTAIHAAAGWQGKDFDDAGWKAAVEWTQAPGPQSAPLGHPWIPDSVKDLRHEFDVSKPVKSARLYATALGAYEMFLNGKRVGDQVMAPGWTDYRERLYYQTYDVTRMVHSGSNAMGALLAPGWYETPLEWFQQPNNYGDTPPALRAELRIEHADGSVEWVTTDETWTARESEIRHAEIYDGETQDARQAQPGWDTEGFNPAGWKTAQDIAPKPVTIDAQDFPPIRVERALTAVSLTEPKPGVWVYDFGQNQAGVERVRVSGPAGTKIRLRFAELLNADGTLYTENLRTAKATDYFILGFEGPSGPNLEEFTPQFTYHGYRYAELTGLPTKPAKNAVTALVFHTDAPFAAKLTTGNAMINKLWSNIEWGQRSNFMSVPTDCPQRDERLGWMGDAQVFWRTASYNMQLAAFSRKFGGDMRGTQAGTPFYGIYSPGTVKENAGWAAGWSDAGVIIPWTSWLQTGDTSVIQQNWAAMEKYLDAIEAANPDGLWRNESGIAFGDWLAPEGKTNQVLIATAYWAYDVTLMREMARATGRRGDERKYSELFEKIRAAFEKEFVRDDGFVAGADKSPSKFGDRTKPSRDGDDTQTGYVLALHMNLVPQSLRAAAGQKLADKIEANHGLLGTGFLGTPYLLEELTKTGHAQLAYKLLFNTAYPSWGYLVEHGATTMWERWNGDQMRGDPSMNSYNHYAYGAVADWIYRYAAGVDATPMDAGFHTVVLHPHFDAELGSVEFSYPSAYGVIRSDWTVKGKTADWKVTIPANATGWISDHELQSQHLQSVAKYDGSMEGATGPNGERGVNLASGSYEFSATLQ